MSDKIMLLEGPLKNGDVISIRGSYSVSSGPGWGWCIVIEPTDRDAFKVLMYNISPEDTAMLAVETTYARMAKADLG